MRDDTDLGGAQASPYRMTKESIERCRAACARCETVIARLKALWISDRPHTKRRDTHEPGEEPWRVGGPGWTDRHSDDEPCSTCLRLDRLRRYSLCRSACRPHPDRGKRKQ